MGKDFNEFLNEFILDKGKIIHETKENVTKLYIEGRITKEEYIQKMKNIESRK